MHFRVKYSTHTNITKNVFRDKAYFTNDLTDLESPSISSLTENAIIIEVFFSFLSFAQSNSISGHELQLYSPFSWRDSTIPLLHPAWNPPYSEYEKYGISKKVIFRVRYTRLMIRKKMLRDFCETTPLRVLNREFTGIGKCVFGTFLFTAMIPDPDVSYFYIGKTI